MNDNSLYTFCPGCGATLTDVVGEDEETGHYWGLECPNGCDLWEYWG